MLFGNKSSAVDWLVAGLGNPGQKYQNTRHNMGFLTVDLLAEQKNMKLNRVKFKSAYNILSFAGCRCLVMKPQTYMNLSGEAVREAAQFYKVPADHVLVIYDDVSLPVGKLRVRPSGPPATQWDQEHHRPPGNTGFSPDQDRHRRAAGGGEEMVDWVTGVPSQAEREVLFESFERAVQAAACVIEHGCQRAMNEFN